MIILTAIDKWNPLINLKESVKCEWKLHWGEIKKILENC